jgi:hypothetical protein
MMGKRVMAQPLFFPFRLNDHVPAARKYWPSEESVPSPHMAVMGCRWWASTMTARPEA